MGDFSNRSGLGKLFAFIGLSYGALVVAVILANLGILAVTIAVVVWVLRALGVAV